MCLEVIKQARIKKVFYCAKQTKQINYKEIKFIKIEDVENYSDLLKKFFKNKRKKIKWCALEQKNIFIT